MGAFHNPPADSSEKSAENPTLSVENSRSLVLKLAVDLARQIGMTRTWANLQTIRLGIESEVDYSGMSLQQAALIITEAALEWTRRPEYHCPANWELRDIARNNTIDRFWFEDARWRNKGAYYAFRERLQEPISP